MDERENPNYRAFIESLQLQSSKVREHFIHGIAFLNASIIFKAFDKMMLMVIIYMLMTMMSTVPILGMINGDVG